MSGTYNTSARGLSLCMLFILEKCKLKSLIGFQCTLYNKNKNS